MQIHALKQDIYLKFPLALCNYSIQRHKFVVRLYNRAAVVRSGRSGGIVPICLIFDQFQIVDPRKSAQIVDLLIFGSRRSLYNELLWFVQAEVAELVDAHDSKSCTFGCVGSIPTFGTKAFQTFGRLF